MPDGPIGTLEGEYEADGEYLEYGYYIIRGVQGEPGVTRRTTRVGSTRLHSADGIGDESNGVEGAGEPN